MDELDGQRQELKNALAAAKLKEELGLKKEHPEYRDEAGFRRNT